MTAAEPRSSNRYRQLISAAFTYASRDDTYGLTANPAAEITERGEPAPAVLDFCEPEEIEQIARFAAADDAHRKHQPVNLSDEETQVRQCEAEQNAELHRIAAYTGFGSASCLRCVGAKSTCATAV